MTEDEGKSQLTVWKINMGKYLDCIYMYYKKIKWERNYKKKEDQFWKLQHSIKVPKVEQRKWRRDY